MREWAFEDFTEKVWLELVEDVLRGVAHESRREAAASVAGAREGEAEVCTYLTRCPFSIVM